MRNRVGTKRATIVTTSWDDGHPLDIRLANMLHKHGMSGTFYTPLSYNGAHVMTQEQLRDLRTIGMEVGSHTLTHPNLTKITRDEAMHELLESKNILENMLGEPVVSFCYPKGKFNSLVRSWVMEADYKLARTTLGFTTELAFDPLCMPVSLQFFPHSRAVSFRHALKEGNVSGLLRWYKLWHMESNIMKLSELLLSHVLQYGGILHLWGHSWEIEKYGLWELLDQVLSCVANRPEVLYLTNAEVLEVIGR